MPKSEKETAESVTDMIRSMAVCHDALSEVAGGLLEEGHHPMSVAFSMIQGAAILSRKFKLMNRKAWKAATTGSYDDVANQVWDEPDAAD